MIHRYWTIRFVPDPVRDESVNLGVVVGSADDSDWAIRHVHNPARASHLGGEPERALAFIRTLAHRVEDSTSSGELLATTEPMSRSFIEHLRAHQHNSVQLTDARTVVAESAEAALDLIYPLMVEEPERRQRSGGRQRITRLMADEFTRRFETRDVPIRKRVSVRSGAATGNIDFILGDDRAVQIAQAWSFTVRSVDLLQQQVQSWNWLLSRLRADGATVAAAHRAPVRIARDVPVLVVHDQPLSEPQEHVWEAAREAWGLLDVDIQTTGTFTHAAVRMERDLLPV